jgi:Family of unknown function (DUF5681)
MAGNPNPKYDHLLPTKWQPGQSGNPGGRPKGRISLRDMIAEALKDHTCCDQLNPGGRTTAQCLVEAMMIHAIKGNSAYMKEIIDSNDGKLPDPAPPEPELTMEALAKNIRDKKLAKKRKKE